MQLTIRHTRVLEADVDAVRSAFTSLTHMKLADTRKFEFNGPNPNGKGAGKGSYAIEAGDLPGTTKVTMQATFTVPVNAPAAAEFFIKPQVERAIVGGINALLSRVEIAAQAVEPPDAGELGAA